LLGVFCTFATMVKSMTGYGKAEGVVGNKKVCFELKSLNSKGLDLVVKLPSLYRSKEMSIRTMLASGVTRGKCDAYVSYELLDGASNYQINKDLLKTYKKELTSFMGSNDLQDATAGEVLEVLMRMPDVMTSSKEELTDADWDSMQKIIQEALSNFNNFRSTEGVILEEDFNARIDRIKSLLEEVAQYEGERIETVKTRIKKNLSELMDDASIDQNRFEQELIYYIEKYDVSEEKVRLKTHLTHFTDTLKSDQAQGKKLGFIAQEMGREINTLGSKANHAEMQKLVVAMKDELEKIKEQVLNTL